MLDLAANQGKFSIYVIEHSKINFVVSSDYDESAVDDLYKNYKFKNNILPLLFDMIRTNKSSFDSDITNRIKCDVVVALALTHHLILTQGVDIEYIFQRLKDFSNKYVIVEFMPLGLYSGDAHKTPPNPNFYNINWFKDNFVKFFDLIIDEKLELNRHVFVGKIRD